MPGARDHLDHLDGQGGRPASPRTAGREAGPAGLLHDVGQPLMPLEVLNKPGKLTADEYAVMQTHVLRGHEMLVEGMDSLNQREKHILTERRLTENPQTLEELSLTLLESAIRTGSPTETTCLMIERE